MNAPTLMSRWTATHVAGLADGPPRAGALITPGRFRAVAPGLDVWDLWPVQEPDGQVARFGGAELWMTLAAPAHGDPVERHGRARLHLLRRSGEAWRDLGPVLPQAASPGSREWSGCTVVDPAHSRLTLLFTAAGRRGEADLTFEQRIFQTEASLSGVGEAMKIGPWGPAREVIKSDGRLYDPADQTKGKAGEIKAFRDPAVFRDPADGQIWLVFAGSLGRSSSALTSAARDSSAFNGAVGLARATGSGMTEWTLLPPILHADGLNNELERPHVIVRDGLYYLFWSTQREVFAPGGPSGPTGLYGMVAPALQGPYEPLNGDGLVLSNPPDAPYQAYSWWVLGDLSVVSFVNYWGWAGDVPPQGDAGRRCFGGAPAPVQHIRLEGSRAWDASTKS